MWEIARIGMGFGNKTVNHGFSSHSLEDVAKQTNKKNPANPMVSSDKFIQERCGDRAIIVQWICLSCMPYMLRLILSTPYGAPNSLGVSL